MLPQEALGKNPFCISVDFWWLPLFIGYSSLHLHGLSSFSSLQICQPLNEKNNMYET
jgi:hypothetical protein